MIVLVFVVLLVVVIGAAVALYVLLGQHGEPSIAARVAQIEESHGIEQEQSVFTRFVSEQQQRLLMTRFLEAGWRDVTPSRFIMNSVIGGVVGFGVGAIVPFVLHLPTLVELGLGFVLAFGGFYYPTSKLESAIKKRKIGIQRNLPDILDIIASTVQAGVALNGAIAIAADGLDGPLAEEMRAALQDIRLGRGRADALLAMAARVKEPSLSATVMAIVQADRLGGDVAQVLEELSVDARDNRLMRAEELANALPNKLVVPMAVFMLPSLFIVIFGALVAHLVQTH